MVTLRIQGLGHVPSFKNNKLLTRGKLVTDPKKQRWMKRCTQSFESQLCSGYRTTDDVTQTDLCLLSLIAWSSRFDDSVQWIPELVVTVKRVAKGLEGATVTIETL